MGKFAIGCLTGCVATIVAFMVFGPVQNRNTSDPAVVEATETQPRSSAIRQNSFDPGSESGRAELQDARSASPDEDNISREARLITQLEEARQSVADTSRELEELRAANRLAADPIVYPLTLPSEFDWVLEETTGLLLHGIIQREARDETWASGMEAELQRFVYARSEVIAAMGPPTITCRSTRCEVTFINSGANESALQVAMGLRSDFDPAGFEDEFALVPGTFWMGERYQDGVATIFWSLPRRMEE